MINSNGYNEFEYDHKSDYIRLYIKLIELENSKNKLSPGVIAVVVVVGAVVLVLVYFLVIKKRTKASSTQEEKNKDANEV